jgi:hypothetical protein
MVAVVVLIKPLSLKDGWEALLHSANRCNSSTGRSSNNIQQRQRQGSQCVCVKVRDGKVAPAAQTAWRVWACPLSWRWRRLFGPATA